MKSTLTIFVLLLLINLGCSSHKASFPGTAWITKTSDSGFDAVKLTELTAYIKDSLNTTGLVMIYDGKMVYQYGDIKKVSYIASCRKSVLSMLYGKYIDNGTIKLDETIGELGITEEGGLLPIEQQATVDNIITSRSGVFHIASNGGYDKGNFLERGAAKPGEYFVYNNWDFNVAGAIFEQKTGNTVYEEIESQLAIPLGFEDWNIKNQHRSGDKKKSQYLAYHMYFSTRDMAKIGQLMLNEGKWEGKQLISKEWIKKSTTMVTPKETVAERINWTHPKVPVWSYSYMWWLIEEYQNNSIYEGAFTASGYGGQYITVIPKMKMVVAHKTALNIPTQIGLTYKATYDGQYFDVVDRLIKAKIN
ncbi:MAG: serine hydrolase domain-containing protein [Bacteroidia bacterium]